jgi:hypothetical protein
MARAAAAAALALVLLTRRHRRRHSLAAGRHPYGGDSPDELYADVLKGPPFFPKNHGFPPVMPPAARELIESLLTHEPTARPPAAALWQLPFFAAPLYGGARPDEQPFSRAALFQRAVRPPFVPRLGSPFDTDYFETTGERSGDEWSDDEEGRDEGRAAGRIIVQQPGGDVALAGELTQALGAGPPSLAGGVSALPAADFQPPTRRCESLEALLGERVGAG